MGYLLDTNIFIAAMKGVDSVRQKLEITPLSDILLSPIVLGELELGVEKSQHRKKNASRLARLVDNIQLIPLDAATSQRYSFIRANLERKGTPIGANDYWIAAQAYSLEATLVTDNMDEFSRITDLDVENWVRRETSSS